jgi:hypothetical protein
VNYVTYHNVHIAHLKKIKRNIKLIKKEVLIMTDDYFIVLAITTKCPKCGDVVTEHGASADLNCCSTILCEKCGFQGELPSW